MQYPAEVASIMVDANSAKFISSLVKSLQMFCHGYMEFEDNIEIIGHINLRIDNRQKLDYIVNEQVSKQGQESTCFQSNSYHSLPPKTSERDQQPGSADEISLHQTVDSSMAVIGGTRVQVDLSGPSPVTRSTFASYPDGFLSPMGSSQKYYQNSESQMHVAEADGISASGLKDSTTTIKGHVMNHLKHKNKDTKHLSHAGNMDSERAESDYISMALNPDSDRQQQIVSGHLQDFVIKAEPVAFSSPNKSGDSTEMRGMMDTSSSSIFAGQPTSLSTTVAHSHASTLPSMSSSHAVSFDTNPLHLESEPTKVKSGRQERVLMCAVGSSGASILPVAVTMKPTLSVTTQELIVLPQGTLPSAVQDLTSLANMSSDEVEDSFPVLSSSDPVVKKKKVETSQCGVCGTHFRNSKLLGMHMRLIHRKACHVKNMKNSPPDSNVQTSILSTSSAVIAFVGARSEEKESSKPATVFELIKSQNESSDAAEVPLVSTQKDPDKNGPMACCFCQILFWNSHDLSEHQKLCGQKYSTENGDEQSSSMCQTCQLVFPDATLLAEHKKSCTGELASAISSPTTCPICHLTFLDPALLSAHLWVCGKPSVSASSVGELSACESGASASGSGSSSSSNVSSSVNSCDKCGKVFQGRTSLVDHINSMHKGMSFKCPDCGETFKWRTCVYRHRIRCCKGKNAAKQRKEKE